MLARKAEGLSDEQSRITACPPSDLTMLGLIRHMAEVERIWSQRSLLGTTIGPIYYGSAHPDGDEDGDFHPPPDATLADALVTYWAEIAVADSIFVAASLDDIERKDPVGAVARRQVGPHDAIRGVTDPTSKTLGASDAQRRGPKTSPLTQAELRLHVRVAPTGRASAGRAGEVGGVSPGGPA